MSIMNFLVALSLLCVAATARPAVRFDPDIFAAFTFQDFNKDAVVELDEAFVLGAKQKENVSFTIYHI